MRRNRDRRAAVTLPPIASPLEIAGCVLWLDASVGVFKAWNDAPGSGAGWIHYSASAGYPASGSTHAIRVFPFKDTGSGPVFSTNYIELSVTDDFSGGLYYINWSWDPVDGASGYRVLRSDPLNGFAFDYFLDVSGGETFFIDSDAALFTSGPTLIPQEYIAATDTEALAKWEDQSGNGHHALQPVSSMHRHCCTARSMSVRRYASILLMMDSPRNWC
jgi:hypothetical protein